MRNRFAQVIDVSDESHARRFRPAYACFTGGITHEPSRIDGLSSSGQ